MIRTSESMERIGDDWLDLQQPDRPRVTIEKHALAVTLQKHYCCAGCWGHLELYHVPDNRMVRVACPSCGGGRGFVTKRFAEQRRSDNRGEMLDVQQMLQSAGVVQYTKRTAEEVLADLGF